MLTNKLRTRYVLRLVVATAAACLLAGPPRAASAMPLRSSAIGSITVTLTGHPRPMTNSTRATFSWRTTGIVGETRCKLDGAAYTYCRGNPGIYGGLSDGKHTFTVRVRNGYQVTAKASFTWLVDTAPPTLPVVSGGSAAWRNVASGAVTAGSAADALSGLAGYQWRVSTEGSPWSSPSSGSAATVKAQGVSYVQFRSLDRAGNASAWAPAGHPVESMIRLDRTPPTAPTVIGGSLSWQDVAWMTIDGAASTDALSGVDRYEYRESVNGGAWSAPQTGTADTVTREGETVVQFRAVDAAGNAGAWTPATPGPENTARIDRSGPSDPVLWGGSAAWRSAASVTISAGGSVDTGFGVDHDEYRASVDGGDTWSAPAAGALVNVTAEGETLVQFRTVDAAGNASAWVPSTGSAGTVLLDRTAPGDPIVAGGSLAWQSTGSVSVSATGGPDTGSGVSAYSYRTSTDGGVSWSAATAGSVAVIAAEGETLVQFQAVDGAGNASAWAPAAPTAGSTVRIDRTAPTAPVVGGGSLAWQSVGSAQASASGGTDSLSGVDHYEYRTSTDNGATWSAPSTGGTAAISAEGVTLVQFRAVDGMGFTSSWAPSTATAASTVKLDHTAPAPPTVAGGSASWLSVGSVAVTATGSTDAGGSGLGSYEYRTSTDGGGAWSASQPGSSVAVTAEGETLVQMRAIDAAGNASAWAPGIAVAGSTVRLDRGLPTAPMVAGGSLSWQSVPSVAVSASGSTDDGSGITGYEYRTSTDGGATWLAPVPGASATIATDGETIVQFRSIDASGNRSSWAPSTPTPGSTVRLDRTSPTAPVVTGGSLAWQSTASVTVSAAGSVDALTGLAGYEYRESTDTGVTWSAPSPGSSVAVADEGQTLLQFRSLDALGNASDWSPASPGAGSTVRIDRTGPSSPTVTGGSLSWQNTASVQLAASGSSDALAGVAGYQFRASRDGGSTWSASSPGAVDTVTAEGETLVQFRSVDAAGNTSAWAAPGSPTGASMARIDRSSPTAPSVSGGSLAWTNAASVTVTASGSTDNPGSGVASYAYRTSTDGGATWSGWSTGGSAVITAPGQTLVQFRATDTSGLNSAWTPASATAGSTVRIDRTAPVVPVVSGGSLSWQNTSSVTISATGSSDALSGLARYEYRTSVDGGTTWSAPAQGPANTATAEGQTLTQFRSVDNAGNTSAWNPGTGGATNTAKIDRTAPTDPSVAGGTGWTNAASVTVTGSGSTDSPGSGVASYQFRTSTDGGATWSAAATGTATTITAAGTTLVQFRATDASGLKSAWAPASPTVGSTVSIDRVAPTAPVVSGGSLAWQNAAAVTVSAAGGSDSGGSALATPEVRASANGGSTWSAPSAAGSLEVTAEGQTLVEFRNVDHAGNTSAWTPVPPATAATVRIDRTAPTAATVTGGSLTCTSGTRTISGSGASDGGGSGVARYEYRISTDGGTTYGTATSGGSVQLSSPGTYVVQFRAVDNAGLAGAWAPASPGAASTACIT